MRVRSLGECGCGGVETIPNRVLELSNRGRDVDFVIHGRADRAAVSDFQSGNLLIMMCISLSDAHGTCEFLFFLAHETKAGKTD